MEIIAILFIMFLLFMLFLPVLLIVWAIYCANKQEEQRAAEIQKQNEIKNDILSGNFIHYQKFESQWIISKKYKRGLKYNDGPGCYVILVFRNPVFDNNFNNYSNVYVGQSVNKYQRVHNHFSGTGNGNIYADIKYGKHVYVKFVSCSKEQMNYTEKRLIKIFNATQSYNRTKGGSTNR